MRRTLSFWLASGCLGVAVPVALAQAPYAPPRTPWGDPDLQAIWSGDSAFGIPHPAAGRAGDARRSSPTRNLRTRSTRDERTRSTALTAVGSFRNDNAWLTSSFRQTSLIIDPPDGRAPPLVAGADAAADAAGHLWQRSAQRPEDFTLYDRCITLGVVGSMTPKIYGNGYRIVQAPGYAVIMAEMIHEARVIPARRPAARRRRRPLLPRRLTRPLGRQHARRRDDELQRQADRAGNPVLASTELKIVERITRVEADLLRYEATVTDPKTYTKPFTISIPFTSPPGTRCCRTSVTRATWPCCRGSAASAPRTARSKRIAKKGIIRPRRPIQGALTVGGQPIPESGPSGQP